VSALWARLSGTLVVLALALILLALGHGAGENPDQALAAYERYRPGRPLPDHLACHAFSEYPGMGYGQVCAIEDTPYCQRGSVYAEGNVITYVHLSGCQFPAAYLLAWRGRFERLSRYRRVVLLRWEDMSATVPRTGWFHAGRHVATVGWWRRA
jgi:hypothetical protein